MARLQLAEKLPHTCLELFGLGAREFGGAVVDEALPLIVVDTRHIYVKFKDETADFENDRTFLRRSKRCHFFPCG